MSRPRVVLVHGSSAGAQLCWSAQQPLAERWDVVAPDRLGYRPGDERPEDFAADVDPIAEELGDGAHLVGFSYGGVVALLAAARRPEAVWSLTLVEPPAFALVAERPEVRELEAKVASVWGDTSLVPAERLRAFWGAVGVELPVPEPLPEPLAIGARAIDGARAPGEARIPMAQLAAARFPVLVVTGGHSPALDAVGEALVGELGAEHAELTGMGHLIPALGAPFNALLEDFWRRAGGPV